MICDFGFMGGEKDVFKQQAEKAAGADDGIWGICDIFYRLSSYMVCISAVYPGTDRMDRGTDVHVFLSVYVNLCVWQYFWRTYSGQI